MTLQNAIRVFSLISSLVWCSYLTFDINFHSVTHCSYRVWGFTFIFSSVFFTVVVNDEDRFIDVCLKHFVILSPSNIWCGITLDLAHQVQYVSLDHGDFTFTFLVYSRRHYVRTNEIWRRRYWLAKYIEFGNSIGTQSYMSFATVWQHKVMWFAKMFSTNGSTAVIILRLNRIKNIYLGVFPILPIKNY